MPFTMPDYGRISFSEANPFLTGLSHQQEMAKHLMQLKYQPRMMEADIFQKQFAPLAQFATSPMALAMAPEQRSQMLNLMSQILQHSGGGMPGASGSQLGGVPVNTNAQAGLSGNIGSSSMGAASSGMSGEPSQGTNTHDQWVQGAPGSGVGNNPNLPNNGFSSQIVQHATGPAAEQLHPPGTGYVTPEGEHKVTSSSGQVASGQQSTQAIENFDDLAPQLKDHAKEFLQKGSNLKAYLSSGSARALRMGVPEKVTSLFSSDPDMAGRYGNLQKDVTFATDQLKLIYPNANTEGLFNRYSQALQILPDDTEKSYNARIDDIVKTLKNTALPHAQEAMGSFGGYSLDRQNEVQNPSSNQSSGKHWTWNQKNRRFE